ncbi:hypothetical protein B0H13DRAFT_2305432 [Mycena leptocephala]|nr:hypothetical protein B0H13DRAFT_2305432 [Mycena leptocephala]
MRKDFPGPIGTGKREITGILLLSGAAPLPFSASFLDPSYSPGPLNERSPSITPPPAVPRKRALKLILYIPRAELDGNQRTLLTHATPFDEALDTIHETIGCAEVGKKPTLTYKLSNALKSTPVVSLCSAADWKGCLDEFSHAEGEKTKKSISVNIIVTEQYLVSLRAKLGVKDSGTTKGKGKGKGKKLPIPDLEHAESGDDDFDDGVGIMEKEKNYLAELHRLVTSLPRDGKT